MLEGDISAEYIKYKMTTQPAQKSGWGPTPGSIVTGEYAWPRAKLAPLIAMVDEVIASPDRLPSILR